MIDDFSTHLDGMNAHKTLIHLRAHLHCTHLTFLVSRTEGWVGGWRSSQPLYPQSARTTNAGRWTAHPHESDVVIVHPLESLGPRSFHSFVREWPTSCTPPKRVGLGQRSLPDTLH